MNIKTLFVTVLLAAALPISAQAETQTLKATVDGKVFESDDDGITLVPVARSFTINAITKGFSGYPSPPGLSDRLVMVCGNYEGKPRTYTAQDFKDSVCHASFTQGVSKQPMGKPQASFSLINKTPMGKSVVQITKVSGKVMEGKFLLEMVETEGSKKLTVEGTFKAENRQI